MEDLKAFVDLDIDWELTPEDAVQMHMEQEESSLVNLMTFADPSAVSTYFVVDTACKPPLIRLFQRDRICLNQLACLPVPVELVGTIRAGSPGNQGIIQPPPEVLEWLKAAMGRAEE